MAAEVIGTSPMRDPIRRRKPAVIVVSIVLALALVGGVGYFFWHRQQVTKADGVLPAAREANDSQSEITRSAALKAGQNNNKAAALSESDKAIAQATNPQDKALAYIAKGTICYNAKDMACAAAAYAAAADAVPKNIAYASSAAQICEEAGDKASAIKYYKIVLPYASDNKNDDGLTGKQVIQQKITELGG